MSENELPPETEGNVTDADLIRYLDGEVTLTTRATLSELIAERADLAARVEQLRHRSARLSGMLASVSPDATQIRDSVTAMRPRVLQSAARPTWWGRVPTGMKAAAAIALLFGVVLGVPDARAWILARVYDVAAALGVMSRAPEPTVPAIDPVITVPVAAVNVAFAVNSDTIDVTATVAGVLIVRRGAGAQATVESSAPDARFTVRGNELGIDGSVTLDARYELTVPERVIVVRVRNATGNVTAVTVPAAAREIRIDLAH